MTSTRRTIQTAPTGASAWTIRPNVWDAPTGANNGEGDAVIWVSALSEWLAVGGYGVSSHAGDQMLHSMDGLTWTVATTIPFGNGDIASDCAWSSTLTKAIVTSGSPNGTRSAGVALVAASSDLDSWSSVYNTTGDIALCCCWTGTKFVVGGQFVGGPFINSPDGTTWTARAASMFGGLHQRPARLVSDGAGTVLAVSSDGIGVSTNNGDTWTAVTGTPLGTFTASFPSSVAYHSGTWAIGATSVNNTTGDPSLIYASAAAGPYTLAATAFDGGQIEGLGYGAEWVAVGQDIHFTKVVQTASTISGTWSTQANLFDDLQGEVLFGVGWNGTIYVAVGRGEVADGAWSVGFIRIT